jgi:hypothetical protein
LNILKEISNSDTVKNLLLSLEKSRLKKEQQISESAMPEQLPPKVRKESVNELIDTTSKGREHIRRNVSINEHERLIVRIKIHSLKNNITLSVIWNLQ